MTKVASNAWVRQVEKSTAVSPEDTVMSATRQEEAGRKWLLLGPERHAWYKKFFLLLTVLNAVTSLSYVLCFVYLDGFEFESIILAFMYGNYALNAPIVLRVPQNAEFVEMCAKEPALCRLASGSNKDAKLMDLVTLLYTVFALIMVLLSVFRDTVTGPVSVKALAIAALALRVPVLLALTRAGSLEPWARSFFVTDACYVLPADVVERCATDSPSSLAKSIAHLEQLIIHTRPIAFQETLQAIIFPLSLVPGVLAWIILESPSPFIVGYTITSVPLIYFAANKPHFGQLKLDDLPGALASRANKEGFDPESQLAMQFDALSQRVSVMGLGWYFLSVKLTSTILAWTRATLVPAVIGLVWTAAAARNGDDAALWGFQFSS